VSPPPLCDLPVRYLPSLFLPPNKGLKGTNSLFYFGHHFRFLTLFFPFCCRTPIPINPSSSFCFPRELRFLIILGTLPPISHLIESKQVQHAAPTSFSSPTIPYCLFLVLSFFYSTFCHRSQTSDPRCLLYPQHDIISLLFPPHVTQNLLICVSCSTKFMCRQLPERPVRADVFKISARGRALNTRSIFPFLPTSPPQLLNLPPPPPISMVCFSSSPPPLKGSGL